MFSCDLGSKDLLKEDGLFRLTLCCYVSILAILELVYIHKISLKINLLNANALHILKKEI